MEEIWRDIKGYEGLYQVSNLGNVKSLCYNKTKNLSKLLKPRKNKVSGDAYFLVSLCKNGIHKNFYIHRLVATYFVENPNGYNEVNHIDGNTLNNNAENLEWCSHLENMRHAFKSGKISHEFQRGAKNKNSKPVYQKAKDGNIVKVWESVNQIQRETKYLASSIFCCCNHRKGYNTAYGYVWEYVNGETNNPEN